MYVDSWILDPYVIVEYWESLYKMFSYSARHIVVVSQLRGYFTDLVADMGFNIDQILFSLVYNHNIDITF